MCVYVAIILLYTQPFEDGLLHANTLKPTVERSVTHTHTHTHTHTLTSCKYVLQHTVHDLYTDDYMCSADTMLQYIAYVAVYCYACMATTNTSSYTLCAFEWLCCCCVCVCMCGICNNLL